MAAAVVKDSINIYGMAYFPGYIFLIFKGISQQAANMV